jgi:hypothetical protein
MKIVGQNFRSKEARAIFKAHPVGCMIALRRDPLNPYDPNAVKAWVLNEQTLVNVGFINKEAAKELCDFWGEAQWGYGKLLEKNEVELIGYVSAAELPALEGAMRREVTLEEVGEYLKEVLEEK